MRAVLERVFHSILVLLVVSAISFLVFQHIGDPTASLLGEEATVQERNELRAELGLDQPLAVQYLHYLKSALHGDFGTSYRTRRPVLDLLMSRLPATIELALVSATLALIVGGVLGMFTAVYQHKRLSQVLMTTSLLGVAFPTFLTGLGLIYLFAVKLSWLPAMGRGQVVNIGGWQTGLVSSSGLAALVLPVITLAAYKSAMIMRLVRSTTLEALRSDYVKSARARGLSFFLILSGQVLPNITVPLLILGGLQLGGLIAFSLVTETVFQWPGIGLLFVLSIQSVDLPVIAAYLLIVGWFFVAINIAVDVLSLMADPRLRQAK